MHTFFRESGCAWVRRLAKGRRLQDDNPRDALVAGKCPASYCIF